MAYKKDYFANRGQCVIDRKILKYIISKGKDNVEKSETAEIKRKKFSEMVMAVYLIAYYAVFHDDDSTQIAALADEYKDIYFFHKMDIDDKAEQYNGRGNSGQKGGAPEGNKNAAKYKDTEKDTDTPKNHNSVVENDDIQTIQKSLGDFVECIPKTTLIE